MQSQSKYQVAAGCFVVIFHQAFKVCMAIYCLIFLISSNMLLNPKPAHNETMHLHHGAPIMCILISTCPQMAFVSGLAEVAAL